MKAKDIFIVGSIAAGTLLGSCSSEKEKCIEEIKIEQINTLVTKPDSLHKTVKNMPEEEVIGLLTCSNLFEPGDSNRVHAVVLQEIGKNFSAQQVKNRPKDIKKYLTYMNIFTLEQMELTNDDMPQKSAYEKARFSNITPKKITFNDQGFFTVKNNMLVIAEGGEKSQFESNLEYNRKEIKKHKSTKHGITKYGQGQTIVIIKPSDIEKLGNQKYGIIQIKGHTGDMSIVEKVAHLIQKDATIVILGGCNSEIYTENVLKIEGIPITNRGLGQGTHNDYISTQLLKQAKTNPSIPGLIQVVKDGSKISSTKFNFPEDELTEKINGAMEQ